MSESQDKDQDGAQVGIGDDALPADLQPGEDNPLAEGLDDGETVDDLLSGGKDAEQLDDAADSSQETAGAAEGSGEERGDPSED